MDAPSAPRPGRRRRFAVVVVVGAIVAALVAGAVIVTLMPDAEDAPGHQPGTCEQLGMGDLAGFGAPDTPIEATAETCTATYADGMAALTVTIRRHPDEAAAAAAFAAVESIPGAAAQPSLDPAWDEARSEQGATEGGWTVLSLRRKGTAVVEIRFVLSGPVPQSALTTATDAVGRVTAKAAVMLA
ncbi:MAG TPA: hypothetical protein VGF17_16780 [Phytomonospora sp.]